ncbi:Alanine dehydrogenase [Metallosphaera sp. J1]|uniref:ornithine cyclodeaminase family protein n=1 Tax=Metallosphaera TaxID=41980 RepID=UPI001EDF9D01|nr:ornithine cyclodeaminase family protein [Metallosphaera javensis (ex Hofmann et al. 2022)]MCG3109383.1 Alanine dehydrogenase [Metallosphaera javensis (ex Hofmann et al. 2022)]BCS92169.1 MAG: ornithine cyclodeaminase [Metallosphaera javensis (ex Sakai et al. 2022)]
MTLLIKEQEVNALLNFKDAYEALREAFILEDSKKAVNTKRVRTSFSGSTLTYQAGAMEGYIGFKTYMRGNFVSLLFANDGELLMIAEADRLSLLRTGALSVLASDVMKKDYSSVGIIGLGKQGIAQVEAFHHLKPGIKILGYTRTQEREARAKEKLSKLGIKLETVPNLKELVSRVEVVVTITTATSPFLKLDHLTEKVHINAMGSNLPERVELFPEVVKASTMIAVEDEMQAKDEAGDLILAEKMGMMDWKKVVTLSELIGGKVSVKPGLTIFKSVGIGLEDVASMKRLFLKAKEKGVGTNLEVRGRWSQG